MRLGISNLIFPKIKEITKERLVEISEVCDFSPTVFYGSWEKTPKVLPNKPYGSNGPDIVALQSLFFGVDGEISLVKNQNEFTRLVEHYTQVIQLAASSSVPKVIFGSPGTRASRLSTITDEVMDHRVSFLADIAQSYGVQLCLEVNSATFNCDYISKNIELESLLLRLNHDGLGLHLDMGQMIEEGIDVIKYVANAGTKVRHLHLSSPDFTCKLDYVSTYCEIIRQLSMVGSQADVILEVQQIGDSDENDLLRLYETLYEQYIKIK